MQFKHLFLFSLLLLPLLAGASPARAGLLEFLFPSLRKEEYNPYKTLQAPFADNLDKGPQKADPNAGLPENIIPLKYPHRTTKEVGTIITTAVSEALTFEHQDYAQDLKKSAKYFNAEGAQQFQDFLQANKILDVLQNGQHYIRSFAVEDPLLLNQGAIADRYRWLYEVHVMVSYMDRGTKSYKTAPLPVNQNYIFTIQVGRIPAEVNGQTVLIERWSGKPLPVKQKKK